MKSKTKKSPQVHNDGQLVSKIRVASHLAARIKSAAPVQKPKKNMEQMANFVIEAGLKQLGIR